MYPETFSSWNTIYHVSWWYPIDSEFLNPMGREYIRHIYFANDRLAEKARQNFQQLQYSKEDGGE